MLTKKNTYLLLLTLLSIVFYVKTIFSNDDFFEGKSLSGSLLSGKFALSNKDTESAAKFFNQVYQKDSGSYGFLELEIESLVSSGKIEEAIQKSELLIKKEKKSEFAQILLLVKLIKNEDFIEASKALTKLESSLPLNTIKPLLQAWLTIGDTSNNSFIKEVLLEASKGKMSPLFDFHAALIYDNLNDKENASKYYKNSLEKSTQIIPRIIISAGSFYERHNKKDLALLVYEKFEEAEPNHSALIKINDLKNEKKVSKRLVSNQKDGFAEAIYNIAGAMRSQRLMSYALQYTQIALYLSPENYSAKILLAQIYYDLEFYDKSLKIYKGIPIDTYEGWASRIKQTEILTELENYKDALVILKKMSNEKKQRTDALYKLGEIYSIQEKYIESVRSFDLALERVKKFSLANWPLFYARGMSYERLGKWQEAEKDFFKALEIYPDQPLVLNYLGYSWIDLGKNLVKAHKMIEKAVEQRPNDAYIIDSLGWSLYKTGKYKEAILELERALEIIPNDPIINDHFGDALWKAGYLNEAIFQWNRVLIYNPDNKLKKTIKKKIKSGIK